MSTGIAAERPSPGRSAAAGAELAGDLLERLAAQVSELCHDEVQLANPTSRRDQASEADHRRQAFAEPNDRAIDITDDFLRPNGAGVISRLVRCSALPPLTTY